MKELFDMFLTFCRIGGFTFGGGYAMLPMLEHEIVENKKWASQDELLDYYAIGQCTPGIISVNCATFIGYKRRGVIGAAFCTAGVVFPSFVIVTLISAFLSSFSDIALVQHAFSAIRIAVGALILNAVIKLSKTTIPSIACIAVAVVAFALSFFFKLSPIIIVVLAVCTGLAFPVSAIGRFKKESK